MRSTSLVIGAALAGLALSASAQLARKPYIVQLADAPVAAYAGGVAGYAATKPAPGARLNASAAAVQAYTAYLDGRQSAVAASIGSAPVTYRYKNILNGFAAWLTDAELAKLTTSTGVRAIFADQAMPVDTSYTPTYLGINAAPNGVWTRQDASGRAIKGEGVIVAHLDTGVWPENASFSDRVDGAGKPIASHLPGTVVYGAPPAAWAGACQAGQGFTAANCNNKLIGARYFNATWKQAVALNIVRTWSGEYLDSPRDADGHGSHTLSTSGGNEGVAANVVGSTFTISGIAPRARVAAYKVCYTATTALTNDIPNPNGASCFQSDSAAAADQAVLDGVDVINFSIGGNRAAFNGVVDVAFANASFAGVFVATSAGNSNVFPGNASTVAHVAPWTMTVGNSTHDRFTVATATLGNGTTATGPSFQTGGLPSKPLILATDAGVAPYASLSDADKIALARCYTAADRASIAPLASAAAALDPAKVAGKIVVCYRGGNVLVNKTQEVADGGGAGAIILNIPAGILPPPANGASANTTFNIAHAVPTVHLPAADAAAVIGYATGGAGTASFGPGTQVAGVIAPVMADTSSRGPNQADPNLLKPDITAPGTDIIAAYTNTSITPQQRLDIIAGTLIPGPGADMISGTSMAAPHVAGAAALLRQANPSWSPYAIKSALMTSAQQTVKLANGVADPSPWGYGAGHLNPNGALDTRVVYDQSITDHIDYYFGAINGRQLNTASLTYANVVGVGSLQRTLTNKGSTAVTYSATASLPGFLVTVAPAALTIPPGGSASYTVTMRRTTAAMEQWSFGHVTWAGSGLPAVRSPLSAKPSMFVGLSSVTDTRNVGTKVFTVAFGYTGSLITLPIGLVPATTFDGRVVTNQRQCFAFAVPAGARQLRAQLFNTDTEGGSASDLDLTVFRGTATVGTSGNVASNELVTLVNPTAAADYSACVDGYDPVNGSAGYRLSVWVVGPTSPGTLSAFGPKRVVTGGVASIGVSWNVAAGARYLGVVDYRDTAGATPIGSTTVFIDNAPTTPFVPVLGIKPVQPM